MKWERENETVLVLARKQLDFNMLLTKNCIHKKLVLLAYSTGYFVKLHKTVLPATKTVFMFT